MKCLRLKRSTVSLKGKRDSMTDQIQSIALPVRVTVGPRHRTTRKALIPRAEEWEWQSEARCRGEATTLFFHPEGERGSARRKRQKAAVAICSDCGVQLACLNHALRVPEMFGTWGGVTEDDRNQYLGLARHPRVERGHPVATQPPYCGFS